MDMYKWTEELATNNAKIDQDHKKIIAKSQELYEAMAAGEGSTKMLETTNFLNDYVKKHFEEEQVMQEKSDYPDCVMHREKHDYFIKELSTLTKNIVDNPTSSINAIKLNKLISGWFYGHIKKLDVEVAKYVSKNS